MLFSDNIGYSFYICQQIKELTIMTNDSFSIRLREARLMMGLSMDKLVDELFVGSVCSFDNRLNGFFSNLLRHLVHALLEETGGVAT